MNTNGSAVTADCAGGQLSSLTVSCLRGTSGGESEEHAEYQKIKRLQFARSVQIAGEIKVSPHSEKKKIKSA